MGSTSGVGIGAVQGLRDHLPAVGLAFLLSLGLTFAPPTAEQAAAATGRLLMSAQATYTVDAAGGAVRVSIAARLQNDKPSDARFVYYWRDLSWVVHPEATNIRVSDSRGGLRVTPVAEDGFIDAQFRLRSDLLYRQVANLTISYDLAGGAPRSTSTIRVGEAFVAFDLWAWGDPGTSSVTARFPAGFEVETFGSTVESESSPEAVTVTAAAIANTDEFWTALAATRERKLASDELTLPGDVRVRILGWPEDTEWREQVGATLESGLPELQELVGLPWPVDKRLEVTEVYAPLLEGYAGVFYTDEQRIEISEDLDDLTIIHEASHAWFNDDLFVERWIGEGLADTYAAAVLVAIGGDEESPDRPRSSDPGRIDLLAWPQPGRVTDETVDIEQYGYNASWYVVSEIFEEIGPAKMREIFRYADGDLIAYLGEGDPEEVARNDDWRRFLDLVEIVGGSERAEQLFRDYVVTAGGGRRLDERVDARAAYADLLEAGDEWLPPIYVRSAMARWQFEAAVERIAEATAILELRDEIANAAEDLDLEPAAGLEDAYEIAEAGFEDVEAAAEEEIETLEELAAARAALDAEPDFVATVGLLGAEPEVPYAAAAAAYEDGDLEDARDAADEARELVEGAATVGSERLTAAGAGVGGAVLLGGGLLFIRRRRRQRAGEAAGASPAESSVPAAPPEAAVVSPDVASEGATLAADPSAPPPAADADPDRDGGSDAREGSTAAP